MNYGWNVTVVLLGVLAAAGATGLGARFSVRFGHGAKVLGLAGGVLLSLVAGDAGAAFMHLPLDASVMLSFLTAVAGMLAFILWPVTRRSVSLSVAGVGLAALWGPELLPVGVWNGMLWAAVGAAAVAGMFVALRRGAMGPVRTGPRSRYESRTRRARKYADYQRRKVKP